MSFVFSGLGAAEVPLTPKQAHDQSVALSKNPVYKTVRPGLQTLTDAQLVIAAKMLYYASWNYDDVKKSADFAKKWAAMVPEAQRKTAYQRAVAYGARSLVMSQVYMKYPVPEADRDKFATTADGRVVPITIRSPATRKPPVVTVLSPPPPVTPLPDTAPQTAPPGAEVYGPAETYPGTPGTAVTTREEAQRAAQEAAKLPGQPKAFPNLPGGISPTVALIVGGGVLLAFYMGRKRK